MEVGDGKQETPPPAEGGDKPPKRKMKTPYQLEILENTYTGLFYPTSGFRVSDRSRTGVDRCRYVIYIVVILLCVFVLFWFQWRRIRRRRCGLSFR